ELVAHSSTGRINEDGVAWSIRVHQRGPAERIGRVRRDGRKGGIGVKVRRRCQGRILSETAGTGRRLKIGYRSGVGRRLCRAAVLNGLGHVQSTERKEREEA